MYARQLYAVLSLVLATSGAAYAVPAQWAGNGHHYEISDVIMRWSDARLFAESQTFNGLQGHLVTITSAEEDAFVFSLNLADTYYHTGAFQLPNTANPLANWTWITGEQWAYENWVGAEPNDAFGAENNMVLMKAAGGWGDMNGDDLTYEWTVNRFVIEYETAVPEPSSLALFGLGMAGLAFVRRRRNTAC